MPNLEEMVVLGTKLGLVMKAGHGLDYENARPVAQIPGIEEVSIGHSIIVRSLFVGLGAAVKEMLALVR